MERMFAGYSEPDLFSDIELLPRRSGNVIELAVEGEATHGRFSDDVTLEKNIHIFKNRFNPF